MKGTEKGLGPTNDSATASCFFGNFGGQILDFGVRVLETDGDA